MKRAAVLDDGQPQSGSADVFGMAFVNAVKPLEYPFPVGGGNADACIGDAQLRFSVGLLNGNGNASILFVVFDGVVTEIIEDLI